MTAPASSAVEPEDWSRTVLADGRVPAVRRTQAHETTRRLVTGSAVGLLLLLTVGYLVGSHIAERQVLRDARRFNSFLGGGIVEPHLTPELLSGDRAAIDQLDDLVHDRLVPRSSLRRVKLWSSDGRIVYSDERREIGAQFALTADQRTAMRTGDIVAEVSDLSREESELERQIGPPLLEVYSRVRTEEGRPLLFETYLSYDQLHQQRATVFRWLSVLEGAGVLLFAGFLWALGRLNLRWVRRQQLALDERSLAVTERARRRVARDLHDGPVQDLVGVSYVVDGVLQTLRSGRAAPEVERLLEGAATSVRSSIRSLRSVMVEVYPRSVHDRGLAAAIDDLAQPVRVHGLEVEVVVSLHGHVSPATTEAIFRATQEAVRNVVNHARARSVRIVVEERGELVRVSIVDDGVGMPPGVHASPEGHLGLSALRDIAVDRQGSLEIHSAPGGGTAVRMELPR
jgi:two-component system NarL family sensor kinase